MPHVLKLEKETDLPMPKGQDDAARRFYGKLLGLREVMKTPGERGVWFDAKGTLLRLRYTDPMPAPTTEVKAHLHVDNAEGFRVAAQNARLRAWDAPAITGTRGLIVSDPFGNRLELREYRTAAARERVAEDAGPDE